MEKLRMLIELRSRCKFSVLSLQFSVIASSLVTACMAVGAERELRPIEGLPFQIGAFDARPVVAGHPRVFFSSDEVERAKKLIEENPAYMQVFDKLIADADKQLDLVIKPLDESWWEA